MHLVTLKTVVNSTMEMKPLIYHCDCMEQGGIVFLLEDCTI